MTPFGSINFVSILVLDDKCELSFNMTILFPGLIQVNHIYYVFTVTMFSTPSCDNIMCKNQYMIVLWSKDDVTSDVI